VIKNSYYILLIVFFISQGQAQDIHFSQNYNTPLLVNPSTGGLFDGKFRLGANYRNQGRSIAAPFRTFDAYADTRITPEFFKKGWFGLGVIFLNDNAGEGALKRASGTINVSVARSFHPYDRIICIMGFGVGFNNYSIDFNKLTFDNQWDGSSFNPDLPNQENYATSSVFNIDLSFGFIFNHTISKQSEYFLGTSLYHINEPRYTYYESSNRVERKLNVHGTFIQRINEKTEIRPGFQYTYLQSVYELLIGVNTTFMLNDIQLMGGIWYRHERDIIPTVGIGFKDLSIELSYDINISSLRVASYYQGGPEISITKIFKTKQRGIPCSTF